MGGVTLTHSDSERTFQNRITGWSTVFLEKQVMGTLLMHYGIFMLYSQKITHSTFNVNLHYIPTGLEKFRLSEVTYMCVPISLTSWWMTSSMQHSGLSSETAELEADKFNLWELVCRSAWERRGSWDSSETQELPQLQEILYYFTRAVTFTRISLTTWLLSLCTLM